MTEFKTNSCTVCEGLGYTKNIIDPKKSDISIDLCKCIAEKCVCSKDNKNFLEKSGHINSCICDKYIKKITRIKTFLKNSDIPLKYKDKFLSYLKLDQNPASEDLVQKIMFIMEDVKKDGRHSKGIVFYSPIRGNGKTLSACILLQELIYQYAIDGIYVKLSSDYFTKLKASYNESDESFGEEKNIIDKLIYTSILVIDDFGVQKGTQWEQEKLYELIDGRYEKQLLTIITSNNEEFRDILKLAATDRIYSRVLEMCYIYELTLPSFRQIHCKSNIL